MTHSPSQSSTEQPLDLEQVLQRLRALWFDARTDSPEEEEQARWTLAKVMGLGTGLYGLAMQLARLWSRAQDMVRQGEWDHIDELAHQGWELLREELGELAREHLDAVEWFDVVEHLDAKVVTWLTDPGQIERVRGVLEAAEWRADRLIGMGLDVMFAPTEPSSPLHHLIQHQDDIEHWVAFLIERGLALKT